jgi:CotH protein/lamin tail-like protein/type IX secretion system substrate protein
MKYYYSILIVAICLIADTTAQNFYDINTINTIEITFVESNWDQLLDQLVLDGEDERLIGSVIINDQVFDSVGVRYKGNSSYNASQVKNPLNVKLDYVLDDQLIEGFGTLKLANVFKDPTFVREAMSYEIARKYMPASQSNFANVYINGTHLGLYTSDQDVDKYFMRTHFSSDENARIKGEIEDGVPPGQMGGVWEYMDNDSSIYYDNYKLESDFGWQELIWFLDTLNNNTDYVDQVLNIDRHLWLLAFSNLLVNLDGPINNPQNYYIYKDDAGRFNPILWDLNESFGVFRMLQSTGPLNTLQLQQLDPFVNINDANYPVISKILTNPTYRKMYIAHLKTIMEENFTNGLYETRALEIQDIIDSDVQDDENKFYTYFDFIDNVYNSNGMGPNTIIGIVQLMDTRVDYLQALSEFQLSAPIISNVVHSPEIVSPNSEVVFTTQVENESDVYLAYKSVSYEPFVKTLMYDDGLHNDGLAGDGLYGIQIPVGTNDIQYYIYAENDDAATFSPAKAEYEFYEISITGDLVINEFMADNENTVADQDGEYDDWIEFYNNGNMEIDMSGYYLSDDATEPDQWMFPDTVISPGGFLIVWADKDEDQEGLHASFKLSASGEMILLSDNNINPIDELYYLQQKADTTTGRYENGTGDFIMMLPTFSAINTDLITGLEESISDALTFNLEQNYPNPFESITHIDFDLEKEGNVTLSVFNMLGENVITLVNEKLPSGRYSYSWNVVNNSGGLYFYSLNVDNRIIVKKMILQ